MCGILGWVGEKYAGIDPRNFSDALDLIKHRGPDGGGLWEEYGVHLGHRRLAIVDLDTRANQPMLIEHLVLVFNGEIYNYRDLRRNLESLGHDFKSNSDSEVLLRAWLQWGKDCLDRLEGMFAFAVWNRKERKLVLVRDRYGEKPLFVHRRHDGLAFCSELPPLVRLAGGSLQEDPESLGLYFLYSYIPAPQTIFRDVVQLEPGTWLEWSESKGFQQGHYYNLKEALVTCAGNSIPTYATAVEQLKCKLSHSVRLRLQTADVPVAVLLSGGIDSSVITALAAKEAERPLSAYSLGFPNDPEFDETDYAKAVARRFSNVSHKVVAASEDLILDFAPQVLDKLGEPFADASILPTSFLCSHIEEKVVLGGDGADELFAGYGVYPAILRSAHMPALIRNLLLSFPPHSNPTALQNPWLRAAALFHRHLRPTMLESYMSWRSYADINDLSTLGLNMAGSKAFEQSMLRNGFVGLSLFEIQATDIMINLSNDMLKKVDYAAMTHGLEVRLPFLDSELVHWALNLPTSFLLKGGVRKRILRDAFSDILPEGVLTRRKMGFLLPIRQWFKEGRLRDELYAMLDSQSTFEKVKVIRLLESHGLGRHDHSVLLWAIYIYFRWQLKLSSWAQAKPDYSATAGND